MKVPVARIGLFLALIAFIDADRTSLKIYEPVQGALACFRRLNATHQIGCSSKLSGDVGVLYLVNSEESLSWVTKTGTHEPYIAILYADHFNPTYLRPLRDSGRVNGVILLRNSTEELTSFSNEKTCPNQGFGLYTKPEDSNVCKPWNDGGTGLMYENWEFPIFLINDTEEGNKVLKCFYDFNAPTNGTARDWPLCAAQLKSFMLAAVDSGTCIRRSNVFSLTPMRICDPLEDRNLWGSLVPRNQSQGYKNSSDGSVIVIAARMDAASMFDKISPGADSAATGMAALFATVRHLASLREKILNADIENVYFMLFGGESFGYIGSSRIVYDMKRNEFPVPRDDSSSSLPAKLKLENIRYYIEFNQVAVGANDPYFAHGNNASDLVKSLITVGAELNLNVRSTDDSLPIPPSSFQSFLAHRRNLPGIVLTNYDTKFRNRFYNSFYDDGTAVMPTLILHEKIASLAATVARTIGNLTNPGSEAVKSIVPDSEFVNQILYCLTQEANCTLFQEITGQMNIQSQTYPLYVGFGRNSLQFILRYLLTSIQGLNVTSAKEDCDRIPENQAVDYYWINGSCYETTVNSSTALSPAFSYDWNIAKDEWDSGLYSTWTESRWGADLTVRIFLKPSPTHEILTLGFGIAIFLLSFIIIGWVTKKSDVIFPTRESPSDSDDDEENLFVPTTTVDNP